MPDLTGMRVTLDQKLCCGVNAIIARVAADEGAFELRCAFCSARRGRLPAEVIEFLVGVVQLFGTPAAPIRLPRAITRERNAMNKNDVFPSKFYKAADLQMPLNVEIASAALVDLKNMQGENEKKLALSFAGQSKQLVCNRTNYDTFADLFGDDTNAWVGKSVQMYSTKTRVGPKLVDCIRVRTAS